MKDCLAQTERYSRNEALVRYRDSITRYIEGYKGLSGYNKWETELLTGGGMSIKYTHEVFKLGIRLVEPEQAIMQKIPLHWEMAVTYKDELIADQEYEIDLQGANELWGRIQNMGKRVRWLHRRARIYMKRHPEIENHEHITRLLETMEYVEYQNARIMATGIFALYVDVPDIIRARL